MIKLDQTVWYMNDGRIHSAKILAIMTVDNLHEDWAHTTEQKELFTPFGKAGTYYATVHGIFTEVFDSKESLLASL